VKSTSVGLINELMNQILPMILFSRFSRLDNTFMNQNDMVQKFNSPRLIIYSMICLRAEDYK